MVQSRVAPPPPSGRTCFVLAIATATIAVLALAIWLQSSTAVVMSSPILRSSFQALSSRFYTRPSVGYKSLVSPALSSLLRPSTSTSFAPSLTPSASLSPSNTFSTHAAKMSATKSRAFLDIVANRRTIYAINNKAPISDDAILAIVKETILNVPSSFNSQSTRLVVLLKEEHHKFWDFVKATLKPLVPEEAFPKTEAKLNGFRAGYGTILFFEDQNDVKGLQDAFALYKDYFPQWSEHTSAMHQFTLWCALEAEGFGANLQHYNPVVDDKVQAEWNVPTNWSLKAQLVFGGVVEGAGDKTQKPIEERLKVFGQ